MNDILCLVIPCYNEEAVLPETAKRLVSKMEKMIAEDFISEDSKICFVNDGSKDHTWKIIEELHRKTPMIVGIKISRNVGHQNALMAGLKTVKEFADMVISLDADLQDDIEVLDQFVQEFKNGCEVVYGVRNSRKKDSHFKRFTAEGFYKMMSLFGCELVFNHADYRLMGKKSLEALEEYKEVNVFLRGIIPMLGFKTGSVTYGRKERFAGESKYPLKKMVAFALEGITSLSIKPIKMIISLGALFFVISICILIYILIRHFSGQTVSGWTSLAISIWAIGGLQLLAIGVVGEYIGKVYLETKNRPRYIIEKTLF
ncbi:glycosyltransferase family 2 protein [Parasporobacterium paucivorans]|uniref:Glycosyltransferase involved in cell wall bisynthesis n=1 Tax=Parasporobacterium paucivorans DSM 15970 TaxID=1122934 RepID=A0A1M6CXU5_9FIRM|nr:glycosyltransferase family 2 protein [Parasporobacterium paucivorans]SHI65852.1 Glycosyltransferase involved in cell wall bisynthesis [Parasporobacterium paucivorans DSM 15970]